MVNISAVIADKYPHFIYFCATPESGQDQHGGWRESEERWQLAGKGREETDGKGNNTPAAGGTITTFAATIYLPQGFPRIPEGAQVVVANEAVDTAGIATAEARQALTRSGVIRISGICQKFDPGRLHSRLWL